MKKYWKIIITICIVVFVGLHLYDFNQIVKQEIIDIAGDKYFYEEEKVDAEYVDSYTFDGKEIKFYFDNYYGIRGSYMIKDDRKINLYSEETDFKSKDLTRIFNAVVMNVNDYDIYVDGKYVEPTVIENEKVRIKIYEYDSDAYVVAVPVGEQTFDEYTVMECRENRYFCDIEMNMDLDILQQQIDSWERVRRADEFPNDSVINGLFLVKSKFYVYEYLYEFNEKNYSFSGGIDENGVAYVRIGGNLNMNLSPCFRLTKEQYKVFMEFIDDSKS